MSLAGARLLARRCPAWKRRESGLLLSRGTGEGAPRYPRPARAVRGSVPPGGNREGLSTVAGRAGGLPRGSDEARVRGVERRGRVIRDGCSFDQAEVLREELGGRAESRRHT